MCRLHIMLYTVGDGSFSSSSVHCFSRIALLLLLVLLIVAYCHDYEIASLQHLPVGHAEAPSI